MDMMTTANHLNAKTVYELKTIAKDMGHHGYSRLRKLELISLIDSPVNKTTVKDRRSIAKESGLKNISRLNKTEIEKLLTNGESNLTNITDNELCQQSIRNLRKLCKIYHLKGASRLKTKSEFIEHITADDLCNKTLTGLKRICKSL